MTDIAPGLLPEGLHDRLPPEAEAAATLLRAVMDATAAHGYERVQPPLAEFEANLVGRLKSTRQQDLLRVIDPVSQRTLALRPDITAQVGRIATTRMAHAARPLRLAYGGTVLKVRGTQLRPEREMLQTGAELIGSDSVAAVAEILAVAIDALEVAGVTGISVDLTLPDLVEALATGPMPIAPEKVPALQASLDGKDAAGLNAIGASAYQPLIDAAGPVDQALKRLRALSVGDALSERLDAVSILAEPLRRRAGVTLDPTERHGFEYQSWIGFSLFGDGVPGEIGRGGSYAIVHADGREEKAVGFSLYLDPLVSAGLGRTERRRVFLPLGTDSTVASNLRADGWATVAAISQNCDPAKLGCTHSWNGLEAAPL
jgi:ATP phosphoribosyltransferase regulatory subunit